MNSRKLPSLGFTSSAERGHFRHLQSLEVATVFETEDLAHLLPRLRMVHFRQRETKGLGFGAGRDFMHYISLPNTGLPLRNVNSVAII